MKRETKKLSFRIYVAKYPYNDGACCYPLTEDETAIDMEHPMEGFDLSKYKQIGENNHFNIYELKEKYR